MNKIFKKIFNYFQRRQMLFVSFAIIFYVIYCYISKQKCEIEILKSAVPVVVAGVAAAGEAAGGTAAAGTAAAAGSSAAAGTTAAGTTAAGSTASGTAAGATTGATSTAAAGTTAAGATPVAENAAANQSAAKAAQNTKAMSSPNTEAPSNAVKNKAANPQKEVSAGDNLKEKPENMNSETTKEAQKEAEKSETEKAKKDSKKDRMSLETNKDEEEEEDESGFGEGSEAIGVKKNIGPIGCLVIFFLAVFFMPLFMSFIISPTSKTINGFSCDSDSKSTICDITEDISNFFEKSKNLILYGKFASNGNVLVQKTEDVYDKYYEEYNVKINIPLLLSSIFADGVNYLDDIDDEGNIEVNSKLRERFNSIEDLAALQFDIYETTYVCILKDDGTPSMQAQSKTKFEGTTKKSQEACGTTNVGEKVYRYDYQLDIENYYTKLEENKDLLAEIYGEDSVDTEEELALLISKIKLQKDTFDLFYGTEEDVCASPGNIPSIAMEDENVNLQTPLKGSYNITSYFGYRGGTYSNHKGIDVVGEKTIYAAGDGVVTRANTEELGGNVIEITHTTSDGRKFVSQYGHLKKMLVSVGDTVVGGVTEIGIMGATGTGANGVHLHFQFWEINSDGTTTIYNPLSLFTAADNYSYQCVGTEITSDTCVSTGGSIAYVSNQNGYNYNLIRSIFRAASINELSETKNNVEFGTDFETYISNKKSNGTIEQKDVLNNIDVKNKKIYSDDEWYSYTDNSATTYLLRSNFISEYGAVDSSVYEHILMGAGKVKGSSYACLGYTSAEKMYNDFSDSHHTQIVKAIAYLTDCLSLKDTIKNFSSDNETTMHNDAVKIATAYFDDSSEYDQNSYAQMIVSFYQDYEKNGESLDTLLEDCTDENNTTTYTGTKGEQCDMYVKRSVCLANIEKYDNDAYWGRFIKQAGTSLARVRVLSTAHEYWGYVRYCNDPTDTKTSNGIDCNLTGWKDSEEFDPAWSTLVGPNWGDVTGGLDCGGFITRALTTYIRRYYFADAKSAYQGFNPAYVLHTNGMCNSDTNYTTHYTFGEGNLVSYFSDSSHTLKPGDVLCDSVNPHRHTIMFIGWDDDNGNNKWDPDELMYFMHTGDPSRGVEIYSRMLSKVDTEYLTYNTYFTINDNVK